MHPICEMCEAVVNDLLWCLVDSDQRMTSAFILEAYSTHQVVITPIGYNQSIRFYVLWRQGVSQLTEAAYKQGSKPGASIA